MNMNRDWRYCLEGVIAHRFSYIRCKIGAQSIDWLSGQQNYSESEKGVFDGLIKDWNQSLCHGCKIVLRSQVPALNCEHQEASRPFRGRWICQVSFHPQCNGEFPATMRSVPHRRGCWRRAVGAVLGVFVFNHSILFISLQTKYCWKILSFPK